MHHLFQTFYALYVFEWSQGYKDTFPYLGHIFFSLMGRPLEAYFPLRRLARNGWHTRLYMKLCFVANVIAIFGGLSIMIAIIIKYLDELSLGTKIAGAVSYGVFFAYDLSMYAFLWKETFHFAPREPAETRNDVSFD